MQLSKPCVLELFEPKRRYIIPLFQRQYVWSRDEQWEPLWEDIRAKTEQHLADAPSTPHFMGAIVTVGVQLFIKQVPSLNVIDGQQRLTTFQLFLAALRDVAQARGLADMAEDLKRHTLNPGQMTNPEEEKFKVWPTAADQAHFRAVMTAGSPAEVFRLCGHEKAKKATDLPNLAGAYVYFYEVLDSFAAENGDEQAATRLEAVQFALQQGLQLVAIELEGEEDPQVIFETLNARGEPLLPSDLLRNNIFLRATKAGEAPQALYDKYWAPFDIRTETDAKGKESYFWKVEERQGRLKRARLDLFLHHFLVLKTLGDVNIGRLYQTYKAWVLGPVKPFATVEAELAELSRYAAAFAQFFRPDAATRLGRLAARLQELDTSTVYPLLLFLLVDAKLAPAELEGMLDDLESYLVRRYLGGLSTKNYNKVFTLVLQGLSRAEKVDRAALQALLLAQEGDSGLWPTDQQLRSYLRTHSLYDGRKPGRIKMVLLALEAAAHTSKQEAVSIHGDLTVEHVMPQQWRKTWPLADGEVAGPEDEGTAEVDVRDGLVHTLGNLTLLTQPLNSSVSNGPYADKRKEIVANSLLKLNAYFQTQETWGPVEIAARADMLFGLACKVWPYPLAVQEKRVPASLDAASTLAP